MLFRYAAGNESILNQITPVITSQFIITVFSEYPLFSFYKEVKLDIYNKNKTKIL